MFEHRTGIWTLESTSVWLFSVTCGSLGSLMSHVNFIPTEHTQSASSRSSARDILRVLVRILVGVLLLLFVGVLVLRAELLAQTEESGLTSDERKLLAAHVQLR